MLVRLFAALRTIFYAVGFAVLWWWVVLLARPLDQRIPFQIPQWLRIPGMIIAVVGGGIALTCAFTFAFVGRGTPAPFDAPREFVWAGPYRFVRNPMYVGAFAVIVGLGLAMNSVSALAVAIGFMILAHLFILIYEEPTLEQKFGQSYLRYKKQVNRWVPKF